MVADKTYPSGLRRVGVGTPETFHSSYGSATPDSIEAALQSLGGKADVALEAVEDLTVIAQTLPAGSTATASWSGTAPALTLTLGVPSGPRGLASDGAVQVALSQQAGTAMRAVHADTNAGGILVIGDSKAFGVGLTQQGQRWPVRLLAAIRDRWPVAGGDTGRGLVPAGMPDPYDALDGRPTTTGTVLAVDTAGLGYNTVQLELGATVTWPAMTWTAAGSLYYGYHTHYGANGDLEVLVDNVVVATVSTAAVGEGEPVRASVPITAGTHTVSMRAKSGTAPVRVMYVEHRTASTGWRLYDATRSGLAARHILDRPGAPQGAASFAAAVADLPDVALAVIALGANDMTISAPAQYGEDVAGVAAMVKTGHPRAGVLVVLPAALTDDSGVSDDVQEYHAAARAALADAPDVTVVSEAALIDTRGPNAAAWLVDTVHPSPFGHAGIAGAAADVLGAPTPGEWVLRGTGSPEGAVTAPPTTEYVDVALTTGAVRWRKISGVGNTGWRVAEGDTGWRAIPGTGWLPNSGAGATANIILWRVRRIGNVVHVKSRLRFTATSPASGVPSSGTIPPGWRPALDTVTATLHQWTQPNAPGGQWAPSIVGTTYVFAPVVTSNDLILTTSYLTDDPWPATLPV